MTEFELVESLRALDLRPRKSNGQWVCRCPVHDDSSPSLSVCVRDGRLLAYCHAGCPFQLIVHALGLHGRRFKAADAYTKPVLEPDRKMLTEWKALQARSSDDGLIEHERMLGIPSGGLRKLGAVWSVGIAALAAPMFTAPNTTPIGVRLRADDGRKWAISGSHNGLFMPTAFVGEGPLYIPEGFTDTAAMVGLGLDAVGRPSCKGGRDLVRSVVKISDRPAVVVSDRDDVGINGAETLAAELFRDGCRVKIVKPPRGLKDVRAWIQDGAGRADIEYLANHRAAFCL